MQSNKRLWLKRTGHTFVNLLLLTLPVANPGFSRGERQLPKVLLFFHFFAENCMKKKEFGPGGGVARPWRHPCSGRSKGAVGDMRPRGPKFLQFHAVFRKNWQNYMLTPPGELALPPRGNPGSATVLDPPMTSYVHQQLTITFMLIYYTDLI